MLNSFWSKPLFWVGFHIVGVILTAVIYRLSAMKERALRAPKGVQRIFTVTFYLLPPLVLPLLPQPRLSWPAPVGIGLGLVLLMAMIAMKVTARRELGSPPRCARRVTW